MNLNILVIKKRSLNACQPAQPFYLPSARKKKKKGENVVEKEPVGLHTGQNV